MRYTPRKLLVTGGAGFVGSHVVDRLASVYPDYGIVVLDKMDRCASARNLGVAPNVTFVRGDVRSADLLSHVLRGEDIDTVLHFAARTRVDGCSTGSVEFTLDNAVGTHVLLEACREWGRVRRFINVSTDEVYGHSGEVCDTGPGLRPANPFSAAKASAEMIAAGYFLSHGLPVITARLSNVYGPRQFPGALIPRAVCLLSSGSVVPVHGGGASLRSFVHVRDVASAFDAMLHRGAVGEVYDVRSPEERSVVSVVRDVARAMGLPPGECLEHVDERPFNDGRRPGGRSPEKLESLGWSREVAWEEGVRDTVAWYSDRFHTSSWWDSSDVRLALRA